MKQTLLTSLISTADATTSLISENQLPLNYHVFLFCLTRRVKFQGCNEVVVGVGAVVVFVIVVVVVVVVVVVYSVACIGCVVSHCVLKQRETEFKMKLRFSWKLPDIYVG